MGEKVKCNHRSTWLIAAGYYEWCYQCGALRKMSKDNIDIPTSTTGPESVYPKSQWLKPVAGGKNPEKFIGINIKEVSHE